jgi:hypothetical protein
MEKLWIKIKGYYRISKTKKDVQFVKIDSSNIFKYLIFMEKIIHFPLAIYDFLFFHH